MKINGLYFNEEGMCWAPTGWAMGTGRCLVLELTYYEGYTTGKSNCNFTSARLLEKVMQFIPAKTTDYPNLKGHSIKDNNTTQTRIMVSSCA